MTAPNENITTLRTNTAAFKPVANSHPFHQDVVMADFARQLERELIQSEQSRALAVEAMGNVCTLLRAVRFSMDTEKPFPSMDKINEAITNYEQALSSQPPPTGIWLTKDMLDKFSCRCATESRIVGGANLCLRCTLLTRFDEKGSK